MGRRSLIALVTMIAALGPGATARACTPGDDGCIPTPAECATGNYNGVWTNAEEGEAFPGAVCVSANGTTIVYAGGDVAMACGAIIVADQTVADDSPEDDPNNCVPYGDALRSTGYLTVRDGASLRYTLLRPNATDRFPVALVYTTYGEGRAVGDTDEALLDAGYAILTVNVRGTGCSGGKWAFWKPTTDAYDVVEWAAAQPWSTGDVGMFGYSSPGISQIFAASTRPPSLRAIAPLDVATDLYRDFAYPGGIMSPTAIAWEIGARQATASSGMVDAIAEGGTDCPSNLSTHPPDNEGEAVIEGLQRPWLDTWWKDLSPAPLVRDIEVPVLTCQPWQDDQVSSRAGSADGGSWIDDLDPATTWAVFTNGYHGTCSYSEDFADMLIAFFDRYVTGEANDFEARPHVQIWHESMDWIETDPSWVTTHPSWPVHVEPAAFYFGADGALSEDPPIAEDQSSYAAPIPSSSMEAGDTIEDSSAWSIPPAPGSYVSWTSEPLAEDLEIFGSGSVDLWLSSTAVDTDVQVTLTEIRPDGQEMYLQRGRLRASHRALDPVHSTALRPVHTHREEDGSLLTPLEPDVLRIELLPVGHVFRAGSSIRITVESPAVLNGRYASDVRQVPAVNTVHVGSSMPSRLVLGRVPGGTAGTPLPACGDPLSTPCRTAM